MSYVICPKIGYIYIYIRYNIYIYTPPNELFAGEDDDMNQLIYPCWVYCKVTSTLTNKKPHGTLMVTPSACHIRRLYRHVQRPCGDASVVKIGDMGRWVPYHQVAQSKVKMVKIQEVPVLIRHLKLGVSPISSTWGWFRVWGWPRYPQLLVTKISISIDAYIAMNRTAPKTATGGLYVAQKEIEQLDWKLRAEHI